MDTYSIDFKLKTLDSLCFQFQSVFSISLIQHGFSSNADSVDLYIFCRHTSLLIERNIKIL